MRYCPPARLFLLTYTISSTGTNQHCYQYAPTRAAPLLERGKHSLRARAMYLYVYLKREGMHDIVQSSCVLVSAQVGCLCLNVNCMTVLYIVYQIML